jgi:tetratricopeptide (TPR) repeat protein
MVILVVGNRRSDRGHFDRIEPKLVMILVCLAAIGLAPVSLKAAHGVCIDESAVTVATVLSGSVAEAQPSEDWPNPRELLARALKHAVGVEDPDERQLLLVEIAAAQSKSGDDRAALATVELFSSESMRSLCLSNIATAQASQGRFKEAIQTCELVQRVAHRSTAARDIAVFQEKAGDRPGAGMTAQSIGWPQVKLTTLLELAALRVRTGNPLLAKETVAQAAELLAKDPELSRSVRTWTALGAGQATVGERRAAQETFRRARQLADEQVDRTNRAYDYYFIIGDQARSGDFAEAWETARGLSDEEDVFGTRIKDKSVRAIAQALTDSGRFAEAEQASTQIQRGSERAHALAVLAEAEGRKGETARAKERLKNAVALVEQDASSFNVLALAAIGKALISLAEFDEARTVADQIHTGIRDEILKNIAAGECWMGNLPSASRTFLSIKNGTIGRHKDECAQILAAERTRSRTPGTLAWSEQLVTPSQRIHALVGMAGGLRSGANGPQPR